MSNIYFLEVASHHVRLLLNQSWWRRFHWRSEIRRRFHWRYAGRRFHCRILLRRLQWHWRWWWLKCFWWCSSRDHSLFQLWGLPNSTTSQYVSAVQTCTDFPSGPVPDLPCPAAAAQPVRGPRSRRVEVGPEPFWEADLWRCCSLVAVGAKSNLLFGDYACPDSTDLSEFASGGIEFPTPSRGGLNLALAGPCN